MDLSKVSPSEVFEAHTNIMWICSFPIVKSLSLKCAVELGIPDIILSHGQPISLSKLTSSLPIHPSKAPFLPRLMRILVHSRFFVATRPHSLVVDEEPKEVDKDKEEEELYSLTLASRLLCKDGPPMTRTMFLSQVMPELTTPLQYLSAWFGNATATAFETWKGTPFWDALSSESGFGNTFNDSMANDSRMTAEAVSQLEAFQGLESLVDVGGGTGTMAKAVAKNFPDMKCTVFDLPHVVADSIVMQTERNLISFVGGDMFSDPIPPSDAILLKCVLHDWDDEKSENILKRCREAILANGKQGGKVIIIDIVIDDHNQNTTSLDKMISTEIQLSYDMVMMALMLGKERNRKEWEQLFFAAGFSRYKITPILGMRSLIEVYP